jgi:hypothetical protein
MRHTSIAKLFGIHIYVAFRTFTSVIRFLSYRNNWAKGIYALYMYINIYHTLANVERENTRN